MATITPYLSDIYYDTIKSNSTNVSGKHEFNQDTNDFVIKNLYASITIDLLLDKSLFNQYTTSDGYIQLTKTINNETSAITQTPLLSITARKQVNQVLPDMFSKVLDLDYTLYDISRNLHHITKRTKDPIIDQYKVMNGIGAALFRMCKVYIKSTKTLVGAFDITYIGSVDSWLAELRKYPTQYVRFFFKDDFSYMSIPFWHDARNQRNTAELAANMFATNMVTTSLGGITKGCVNGYLFLMLNSLMYIVPPSATAEYAKEYSPYMYAFFGMVLIHADYDIHTYVLDSTIVPDARTVYQLRRDFSTRFLKALNYMLNLDDGTDYYVGTEFKTYYETSLAAYSQPEKLKDIAFCQKAIRDTAAFVTNLYPPVQKKLINVPTSMTKETLKEGEEKKLCDELTKRIESIKLKYFNNSVTQNFDINMLKAIYQDDLIKLSALWCVKDHMYLTYHLKIGVPTDLVENKEMYQTPINFGMFNAEITYTKPTYNNFYFNNTTIHKIVDLLALTKMKDNTKRDSYIVPKATVYTYPVTLFANVPKDISIITENKETHYLKAIQISTADKSHLNWLSQYEIKITKQDNDRTLVGSNIAPTLLRKPDNKFSNLIWLRPSLGKPQESLTGELYGYDVSFKEYLNSLSQSDISLTQKPAILYVIVYSDYYIIKKPNQGFFSTVFDTPNEC